jgi:hypothetical protein
MVTFYKGYEHANVAWTYRGKLNSNGLAGTWGDVRWYAPTTSHARTHAHAHARTRTRTRAHTRA